MEKISSIVSNNRWEYHRLICEDDLKIKKIVFALICLMNLAGIVALLSYITTNYEFPSLEGTYFLTPFIGGVLAALILLKIPTYGMNQGSFRNLTNVPLMISEIVALLVFGPTLVAKNMIDWTNYADPFEALRIKNEIETKEFTYVMEKYGPRIDNLVKYGLLSAQEGDRFRDLYERYKTDIATHQYLLKQNPGQEADFPQTLRSSLERGGVEWNKLKQDFTLPTPTPWMPEITKFDRCMSFLSTIENRL